ncbi:hypothetical protein FSP39_000882 [Pinctada imbricata]|uniref:AB hydrolase-1 domain-containing protein n=1 Tax=Pinctada imbricata TaxID=66713 RepID=A0AA88XDD0_PINIB|nr:hypothetical protein FSP39_000882 [Pinctada imbricata]
MTMSQFKLPERVTKPVCLKITIATFVLLVGLVSIHCYSRFVLLWTLSLLLGYVFASYMRSKTILPKLYFKTSPLNDFLMLNCLSLTQPYRQTFWARNAHVQTFLGIIIWLFDKHAVTFEREYLQLNDKGIVALDWCKNSKSSIKRNSPILIVFPGIYGEDYNIRHTCLAAKSKGFRSVVINYRGHGNSYLATTKLNSFGDPQDVRQCILYIKQKFPKSQITAVAIGTGSAVLFSYLGEFGSSCRIRVASLISPIYDMSCDVISSIPRLYQIILLLCQKNILIRHSNALYKQIDIKAALLSWDVLKYHEIVYSRLNNVQTIEQYLEENDPMRDVDDISIPILCINSSNDPLSPKESIPYDIFQYPNMLLLETENGGHLWILGKFQTAAMGNLYNFGLHFLC